MCSMSEASMPAGAILIAMLRVPNGSASKPFPASSSEISVKTACCAGVSSRMSHKQTLAFDLLRRALPQHSFEEHALMGHVLVYYPEPLMIHCQDERLANLPERLQ